jgi:hypothetical protein
VLPGALTLAERAEAEVAVARFAWEEGLERLDRPGPGRGARELVVAAVHDELRRRLGASFTLADLARVWAGAPAWFPDLAARAAPRTPEAWDPAVTLDGAFGRFMRRAADVRRS